MSGHSPPETPENSWQIAGHRRKRSETPPEARPTTTPELASLFDRTPQSYGFSSSSERREQPSMQIASHPIPYLPPLSYGPGPALPGPHFGSQDLSRVAQSGLAPRNTRKTKAHVASACINCKKKHLRCDASRPCRRCVQSGKEDTCKDVEHKKRGRPPLKPEDPGAMGRAPGHMAGITSSYFDRSHPSFGHDLRGFGNPMYPPILPNAQPSVYGHQRTNSRSSLYSGLPSPYAPPSIAHSPMTASGSGFSWSRPQTASSQVSLQAPSPFVTQGHTPGHDSYPRQSPLYGGGYGFPTSQSDSTPASQGIYAHYQGYPRESTQSLAQTESHYGGHSAGASLQLPPIRSAPHAGHGESFSAPQHHRPSPVHAHHAIPAPRHDDEREPDPKRPRMDIRGILGPRQE